MPSEVVFYSGRHKMIYSTVSWIIIQVKNGISTLQNKAQTPEEKLMEPLKSPHTSIRNI